MVGFWITCFEITPHPAIIDVLRMLGLSFDHAYNTFRYVSH
jgi:hypothetical protein